MQRHDAALIRFPLHNLALAIHQIQSHCSRFPVAPISGHSIELFAFSSVSSAALLCPIVSERPLLSAMQQCYRSLKSMDDKEKKECYGVY
jgi:hypothetical protein